MLFKHQFYKIKTEVPLEIFTTQESKVVNVYTSIQAEKPPSYLSKCFFVT